MLSFDIISVAYPDHGSVPANAALPSGYLVSTPSTGVEHPIWAIHDWNLFDDSTGMTVSHSSILEESSHNSTHTLPYGVYTSWEVQFWLLLTWFTWILLLFLPLRTEEQKYLLSHATIPRSSWTELCLLILPRSKLISKSYYENAVPNS